MPNKPCDLPCDPLFQLGITVCLSLFLCQRPSQHGRFPFYPLRLSFSSFCSSLPGMDDRTLTTKQTMSKGTISHQNALSTKIVFWSSWVLRYYYMVSMAFMCPLNFFLKLKENYNLGRRLSWGALGCWGIKQLKTQVLSSISLQQQTIQPPKIFPPLWLTMSQTLQCNSFLFNASMNALHLTVSSKQRNY